MHIKAPHFQHLVTENLGQVGDEPLGEKQDGQPGDPSAAAGLPLLHLGRVTFSTVESGEGGWEPGLGSVLISY